MTQLISFGRNTVESCNQNQQRQAGIDPSSTRGMDSATLIGEPLEIVKKSKLVSNAEITERAIDQSIARHLLVFQY